MKLLLQKRITIQCSFSTIPYICFLLLFVVTACKTTKPPFRPEASYLDIVENKSSTINIPIQINLNQLEDLINRQLQGVLFEDSIKHDDGLLINATKSDDIKIGLSGDSINYEVPLDIWIQKSTAIADVEAVGSLVIKFNSVFTVDSDWMLYTVTQISGHDWIQKPKASLGILSFPVESIANRILRSSYKTIEIAIDNQVSEQLNLKHLVLEAWEAIQHPVLISEEYRAWLQVRPQNLAMTPLEVRDSFIHATLVAETFANVSVGTFSQSFAPEPLPSFAFREKADKDFYLNLNTIIPYTEAEKLAKEQLIGETFQQGKRKVTIEDIQLYAQNDKIIIDTRLSGSYDGDIYLTGVPVYDPNKKILELADFDYELKTENFLHKSLSFLFKKGFRKRLANAMEYPMEDYLNEIRDSVQSQLANYEIQPGIFIQGEVENIDVVSTSLNRRGIVVTVESKGALELIVARLDSW